MKKKLALSAVCLILLVLILMAAAAKPAPNHPYYVSSLPYPLVIAHQGGDGLWPGSPSFYSLQVPEESSGITIMTAQFVRAAHKRNLRIEPWTIDDPEQMNLYIDWGVDGIITDRPDLMLKVLGR